MKLSDPDPDIPYMSLGAHWTLRILALIILGLVVYTSHR